MLSKHSETRVRRKRISVMEVYETGAVFSVWRTKSESVQVDCYDGKSEGEAFIKDVFGCSDDKGTGEAVVTIK